MSFTTLGLAPEFIRAVADQGYTEPTPVQAEAIPLVLAGRDLMAGAQTGTGKTAAFVLPMLQNLGEPNGDPRTGRRPIRALVLAPTRELALQVEESVRVYGRHWGVRSAAIYGGVGINGQISALRRSPDVVVATPGRLLDHVGQRTIDLSAVEILVLDEADRMLDMGFIRDIRKVLALLPARRQNLLFSATFSNEIRQLASGFLHDPATVQVTPRNSAAPLVTQVVHPVDRERKRELLSHLIRTGVVDQALVFTRTKHGANRLAQQLERDGIGAAAIHGNRSQGQRVRALADFKAGRMPILVATEIAARGLDIDQLPHVVNFELPMVPADYVHRIGRTGRAGSTGLAVSLVCVDEHKLLREIEAILGKPIPQEVVAGFEPDRSIRPEPILRGGLGSARPQGARGGRGPAPVRAGTPFRGGEARPVHRAPERSLERQGERPSQGRPAQGRPAQGRPAQGRPAQGRPAQGRPGPRPATLRPGQSLGQRPMPSQPHRGGRTGDRPSGGHGPRPVERHPAHGGSGGGPVSGSQGSHAASRSGLGGRPATMPGERIASRPEHRS
jgi:ATP-dependent RNA helicase RhlE